MFFTAEFAVSNVISRHTNLLMRGQKVVLMKPLSVVVFGDAAKHHASCTLPSPVTSAQQQAITVN